MTWILEFIDVKISIQNFGYAFQLLITVENMSSNKFNQFIWDSEILIQHKLDWF